MMGALTGREDLLSGVEAIAKREGRDFVQSLLLPSTAGFRFWGCWTCTSVQAAGVPLAGGALEERRRPGDQRTGLLGLGLGPTAVAELGA